ncbi:MAG TPA: ArsR family transcriptional regulator [Microlunatus sp.]|nr:ArsR family transcriptional regulator [Microlunatus sp.]
MTIERTSEGGADLARRARIHAALADPGRLAIVDTLALTDASPTELQKSLGMTSNLLAHHLGVLEREGLVRRHRSEADRRRSYLTLVTEPLETLLPSQVQQASRVVFVCTANTARSQLAAALWNRSSPVPATSAGTHPAAAIAPGARKAAARHGLPLPPARPRHLDELDHFAASGHDRPSGQHTAASHATTASTQAGTPLLITVCDNAHEELEPQLSSTTTPAWARRLHWSVPDPVPAGTTGAFDSAYDDLARRVTELAPRVVAC